MTPKQLAQLIREFLIRAEKRSAFLLAREFEEMKDELARFLIENGVSLQTLDDTLAEAEKQILERSVRFSSIVCEAQRHVIRAAARVNGLYLKTAIFRPDTEAVQKLIGRTQTGESLTKFFQRLKEPVREAVKKTLIDGLAEGKGAREIASDMKKAGVPYARALVISRTETVSAYREASKDFYRQAGIKRYVWMALLDPRTCAVCWRLHGSIWPTAKKVTSHPACRCTLIPVTKGMRDIENGAARFATLEEGFQKQILGNARYELFKGGMGLREFVGAENSKEFGMRHFVKPLSAFPDR